MQALGVLLAVAAAVLLIAPSVAPASSNAEIVHHLDLEHRAHFTSEARTGFRTDTLRIFCFAGQPRCLAATFRTVRLRLRIGDAEQYAHYVGDTPADVQRHYEAKRSLFSWSHLLASAGGGRAGAADVRLAAFNQTCVGIETAQAYTVRLHLVRLDVLRFAMFAGGVLLFGLAHRLTRMPFFYYSSGVGLGVTLSVFLVVWIVARQLPKRSLMVGTVIGGWALLWYCMQSAWDNALALIGTHQMYVFYYVCTAGLISFVACYRIGPPTNQRSIDIVRWSLQAAAVALIYASSEYAEVTVATVLLLSVWYYVPWRWLGWVRGAWRRRFPVAPRLLTAEEFEEQARENTRAELAKMMAWCGSPEAKPWQTVARLKDPKRFAEFVERGVHLTEEEQFDHTHSMMEQEEAEGGGETPSDDEEEEEVERPKQRGNAPEISDDDDDEQETAPAYGWRVPAVRLTTPRQNGQQLNRSNGSSSSRRQQLRADLAEISSDDD